MPFRFGRTSQSTLERLVSAEHWWHHSSTPKDRRCYCIQVRVTLGDRGCDQPQTTLVWGGCLITDIFQEAWSEDWITETVVLSPEEAVLFFGRCSRNEGLPYCRARNIEFGLGGLFKWAGRLAQREAPRKTVQKGGRTITEVVVEKKVKARGPGWQQGKARHPRTPAVVYDIKEWIQGLEGVFMGNWNGRTLWTTELVDRVSTHSEEAKVKEDVGGKEPHGFQGNLQEVHPLWEETVQMDRVTEACGSQTWWGILREADDQGGQE